MQLMLFHSGATKTVSSERAAKRWAREKLGAKRLKETPINNGWQYWDARDDDENAAAVTVLVL